MQDASDIKGALGMGAHVAAFHGVDDIRCIGIRRRDAPAKNTVQVFRPEVACRAESAGAFRLLRLQQDMPNIRLTAGPEPE